MAYATDYGDAIRALYDLWFTCEQLRVSIDDFGDRMHTDTEWEDKFRQHLKRARHILTSISAKSYLQ